MYRLKQIIIFILFSFSSKIYAIQYVNLNATGLNDGTSWTNAWIDLQDAIDSASVNEQIWIVAGTYYPTSYPSGSLSSAGTSLTSRDYTFYMGSGGVKLYGGFAGTENSINQRDTSSNRVILSGNIGSVSDPTDNCYHVICMKGSAVTLNGLTVSGGYANGSGSVSMSSTFLRNSGGGVYQISSADVTAEYTTITNNYAERGGGIYGGDNKADILLKNSIISNNSATDGGGLFTKRGGYSWSNVVFYHNTASTGGALSSEGGFNIKQVLFLNNSATTHGGAIYTSRADMTLLNCNFIFNSADTLGGGIYYSALTTSQATNLTNTLFFGNSLSTNSTRSSAGADIYYLNTAPVTVTNSIMQLVDTLYSSSTHNQITSTSSIFNTFPNFADTASLMGADGIWMTQDDGLMFYRSSPAYAAGTTAGVSSSSTDITGATWGSPPSIGAYKGYTYNLYFVKNTGNNSNTGTSWSTAKSDLQNAIDLTIAGDEIWIASGTYKPTFDPASGTASGNTRDYSFYLDKSIKIYGGFSGAETALNQRNIALSPVILSGDIGTSVTTSDNCYHVIITDGLASTAVIDGVTICDGNANGTSTLSYSGQTYNQTYGGGIYNIASSPTISNVTFLNNIASDGGGIYNNSSSNPTLNNLNIISNSASNGGGIYTNNSLSLVNCNVLFNSASTNGGGIYNNAATSTTTTLKNSIFFGNEQSSASNRSAAGADIYFVNTVPVTATNSMMQLAAIGSYTSSTKNQINTSTSNLFAVYPSFIDTADLNGTDNAWMTYDDGLRLGTGSSAIAAGTATGAPSTDLIGEDRPSTPSIGAYEGIYCTSSKTLPATASTTYTSSYKSTDTNGWTHYCDASDQLLLSLEIGTSGAVIAKDEIQLKLGDSTVYTSTSTGGLITNSGGYSVIDRRWSVVPTTQPSNGNVGVRSYFTAAEVSAVNTALGSSSVYNSFDDLQMFKAQTNVTGGGTATAFADPHTVNGIVLINGGTVSTTVWEDGTHGKIDHFAEFEVSSFSGGGGGGGANGSPLPVEFIHFDAQAAADHTADLHWVTASEINNSQFEIERSYDGKNFEVVGKVAGNGNSQHLIEYSYSDETISPLENTVYYRLKQGDFDGAFEYSDVRVVLFDGRADRLEIAAYPNPFNQEVTVLVNANEPYAIQVTDINGVVVLSVDHTEKRTNRLDISKYTAGVYIIEVTSTQGTQHLKIIKQ